MVSYNEFTLYVDISDFILAVLSTKRFFINDCIHSDSIMDISVLKIMSPLALTLKTRTRHASIYKREMIGKNAKISHISLIYS